MNIRILNATPSWLESRNSELPIGRRHGLIRGLEEIPDSPPLVFIYLGNSVPSYARHSLRIAARNYPHGLVLITDDEHFLAPRGVNVINPGDWYDPARFESFSRKSSLDPLLSGGFWLLAAERLFVLRDFMTKFEIGNVFHAELDVLISDLSGLATALDSLGQGIFAPMDGPKRALASLMYVNDIQGIDNLLDFAIDNAHLGDEMAILGAFMQSQPKSGHALPSDQALCDHSWPYTDSTAPLEIGLVDAVAFGKWISGLDPRYKQETTFNKARNEIPNDGLQNLRFSASALGRKIQVREPSDKTHILRTVHIHSKIHRRLVLPFALTFYCWAAGLPWRTPVVIEWKSWISFLMKLLLSDGSARVIKNSPEIVRMVLTRTLIAVVHKSPRSPSNRQRRHVTALLPTVNFDGLVSNWERLDNMTRDFPKEISASQSDLFASDQRLSQEFDLLAWLHTYGDGDYLVRTSQTGRYELSKIEPEHQARISLIVSSEKDHSNSRHAVSFWPDGLNRNWSFSRREQVVRSTWIREMFPGGVSQILDWARCGIRRPDPNLSALISYGMWAMAMRKPQVQLVAARAIQGRQKQHLQLPFQPQELSDLIHRET